MCRSHVWDKAVAAQYTSAAQVLRVCIGPTTRFALQVPVPPFCLLFNKAIALVTHPQ